MSALAFVDEIDALDNGALFSPCRRWRYILWRRWDPTKLACAFIGLNPSTADERHDDPTVRRCIRYAMDWGYGSMWMLNIFAFRATNPVEMKAQGVNAVGPRNNEFLFHGSRMADLTVAAWGAHGSHLDRDREVCEMLENSGLTMHVLGLTKAHQPRHPLYLRRDLTPLPWVHGIARRQRA